MRKTVRNILLVGVITGVVGGVVIALLGGLNANPPLTGIVVVVGSMVVAFALDWLEDRNDSSPWASR